MLPNYCTIRATRECNPKKVDISATPVALIILRNTLRGINMKTIELSQGYQVIVDDADFEWLSSFKWCFARGTAKRHVSYDKKTDTRIHILMHREIMNAPAGMQVDHINHNTLDNRRENLRLCNNQQNHYNLKPRSGCTSKYKGVTLPKGRRKWDSNIRIKGKRTFLGAYYKEIDAAKAYDRAAIEHHGEFACVNFPEQINRYLSNTGN